MRMFPSLLTRAAVFTIFVVGFTGAALATTTTASFIVSANVLSACITSATALSFGNYSAASATALTGTSTVSVDCTTGTPYTVALNVGSGGGTFAARKLSSGTSTLNYNLFTSAANTSIWGDSTSSTVTMAGTGSGLLTANSLTVYGTVPISQDVVSGVYSSTVTVTVTY
jgi:spore coat protein U-like protein